MTASECAVDSRKTIRSAVWVAVLFVNDSGGHCFSSHHELLFVSVGARRWLLRREWERGGGRTFLL